MELDALEKSPAGAPSELFSDLGSGPPGLQSILKTKKREFGRAWRPELPERHAVVLYAFAVSVGVSFEEGYAESSGDFGRCIWRP